MVRIVNHDFTPKSVQQMNRINGVVFEQYAYRVLDMFFSSLGDKIVFHRRVPDIVADAGYKASRVWVLTVDRLPFNPLIFVQMRRDVDVLDYLNTIRDGDGVWSNVLRERRYRNISIIRLDRYGRVPDFVVVSQSGKVVIVDSKYRSHRYAITVGDIQRLLIYYEVLRRALKDKAVGKPILLFNITNPSISRYLIEKPSGKGVRISFTKLFLESYTDEDDEYEVPSFIVRKEAIRKEIGRKFYITFIEWYLKKLDLVIDDEIEIERFATGNYVARSKNFGEFYKGKIKL